MDCLRILVWNVRGLNSRARRSAVDELVANHLVSVVCLQESKLSVVTNLDVATCGSSFSNFVFVPAQGAAGGLVTAWQDANLILHSKHACYFFQRPHV